MKQSSQKTAVGFKVKILYDYFRKYNLYHHYFYNGIPVSNYEAVNFRHCKLSSTVAQFDRSSSTVGQFDKCSFPKACFEEHFSLDPRVDERSLP